MKIALVCNEFPPRAGGGIGRFSIQFARALIERGHSVRVYELGSTDSESSHLGVRVRTVSTRLGAPCRFLVNRMRLASAINSDAAANLVDVVEAPEFEGLLAFGKLAVPIALRLHHSATSIARYRGCRPSPLVHFCESRCLRRIRNWIAVSRFILQRTSTVHLCDPDRYAVITNPAPDVGGVQRRRDTDRPYLLFAGRLETSKGVLSLARAASPVLAKETNLRLVFAGQDCGTAEPVAHAILSCIDKSVQDRVEFLGHVSHGRVLQLMSAATAFVLPSYFESSGLVALEAMALGVPVVFTRRTAGPELIDDGANGILVDPDEVEDFSKKLSHLVANGGFADAIGRAGKLHVQRKHSIGACIDATMEFYSTLV